MQVMVASAKAVAGVLCRRAELHRILALIEMRRSREPKHPPPAGLPAGANGGP
jgi:hypothetical protein